MGPVSGAGWLGAGGGEDGVPGDACGLWAQETSRPARIAAPAMCERAIAWRATLYAPENSRAWQRVSLTLMTGFITRTAFQFLMTHGAIP